MAEYDLVIRGGTLVDGTGAEPVRGDLGIRGGVIAAMGDVKGDATRTLEADGHVVCPGFVDIHTHYDAQVFWDRMLSISPWHGVTSVVAGNCGFGIAPTHAEHRDLILRTLENVEGMSINALREGVGEPDQWPFETFPEYLDAIEANGVAINFGALVGHTPVRMYVMGEESTEREATADEIAQMRAIVADAIAAGAIGFATSKAATHVGYEGRPVPSRAASFEEIETLARCLGEAGRGTMQVTNGRGLFLDEFESIQKQIHRPISWTALLQGMGKSFGNLESILERSQSMQEQGIEVYPQVMPRPLNFEFQFKTPFIFEAYSFFKPVSQADFEGRRRLYADPDFRAKFKQRAERGGGVIGRIPQIAISWFPEHPELEERTIGEVAAERGQDPVDCLLDLGLEGNLEGRFRAAVFNTDEKQVGQLLEHPATMLGLSDAGAHASQLCDACAPTYLLAKWVREKGLLPMEEAIRMLTSQTADVFGITDRGRLQRGLAADVTVFDPETVGCSPLRRVYDFPAGADRLVSDATGVRAVVVNGTVIREDGADALDLEGPMPGRVLRGGSAS